jgi:hypothetical protein
VSGRMNQAREGRKGRSQHRRRKRPGKHPLEPQFNTNAQ